MSGRFSALLMRLESKKLSSVGITATPPHKDIRKTALGATESVQWQYCENTIDVIQNLQSKGIVVLAVEQAEGSTSFVRFHPSA